MIAGGLQVGRLLSDTPFYLHNYETSPWPTGLITRARVPSIHPITPGNPRMV